MNSDSGSATTRGRMRSPFLPILLVTVAWLVWTAFETDVLVTDHSTLQQLRSLQDPQLEQVQKLRLSYRALLVDTEVLADQGDANAKLVIEQLKTRGIAPPPTRPAGPGPKTPR